MVLVFQGDHPKMPKLKMTKKLRFFNLCQVNTPCRGQKIGPNAISNQLESPKGVGNRTWRTVLDFFGSQYLAPLLGRGVPCR